MKKKIAIALAVCLVIVGIMAPPVFAKADKVDLIPLNGELGSGFVIGNSCGGPLSEQFVPVGPPTGNYYKGAGLLRVSLKGAEPNATYHVCIVVPHPVIPDDWIIVADLFDWMDPPFKVETNKQGNGSYIAYKHLGLPPQEAHPYYGLSLDDGSGNQVLRFVTEETVDNIIKEFPPHFDN